MEVGGPGSVIHDAINDSHSLNLSASSSLVGDFHSQSFLIATRIPAITSRLDIGKISRKGQKAYTIFFGIP